METVVDSILRTQLLDRRQKLETAVIKSRDAHLMRLLQEVDSALARMDQGSYGLCEVCHDPIEAERLMADPLVCACLDHLNSDERRALERDLELASHIQRGLLPRPELRFDGWEITYHYEPVGLVSGDYCDVVQPETEGGDFFFLLGDVSGKGVAASMLMSHLHAIFRSLLAMGLPVNQLVEHANRIFCESTMSAQYATLVCGRAGRSGEVEVCNAGHCPPLLVHGGEVTNLEATGLPIGLFSSGLYSVKRVHLAPGDSLLLYTDGLSEAQDLSRAEYGAERLSRLVKERHAHAPPAMIRACLEDMAAFRSGAPKTDDLTIMMIRRVG
jgi:sigma-B regulation protein RsbU (phosphoserine phosphatase)